MRNWFVLGVLLILAISAWATPRLVVFEEFSGTW